MLVLTRKVGQRIFICDDLEIVVTQIKGKQVRIGIQGDRHKYPALREEIKNVGDNSVRIFGERELSMRPGDNL